MILLPHAFLVAGFFFGFALQYYLPTHRRNWRFWAIIGVATLGLYIAGHSVFPPTLSVGFVLTLSTLTGFGWNWINLTLRRRVFPRPRLLMSCLIAGVLVILILTFVNGHSFMASAVTVGMLLAIFGGLWHLATRLLK